MENQEKPIVINIGKLVENINITGNDVSDAQADGIASKIQKTLIDAINCISPETIKERSKKANNPIIVIIREETEGIEDFEEKLKKVLSSFAKDVTYS